MVTPVGHPDPKTALLGSSSAVSVNLNHVQQSHNKLVFIMEDKLGQATEVGLDSLQYTLSQNVLSVTLIVTLDDGITTYRYHVSISVNWKQNEMIDFLAKFCCSKYNTYRLLKLKQLHRDCDGERNMILFLAMNKIYTI